jgi:hypothetical protein
MIMKGTTPRITRVMSQEKANAIATERMRLMKVSASVPRRVPVACIVERERDYCKR